MAQQIQELIDKIKTEGLQAADQKAQEIEKQARQKAQAIVTEAQQQAQKLLSDAHAEIRKKEQASQMALKQAARDVLLSLKKEIQKILKKIITTSVQDTLTAEHLAQIIIEVSKKAVEEKAAAAGIEVFLNPRDLKKLEEGFLAKVQKQLKCSIEFRPAEDIDTGFTISFDQGKSSFDFTETSLAEYLGVYLNEQIAALVKEALESK